jgi:hypothetical protein
VKPYENGKGNTCAIQGIGAQNNVEPSNSVTIPTVIGVSRLGKEVVLSRCLEI